MSQGQHGRDDPPPPPRPPTYPSSAPTSTSAGVKANTSWAARKHGSGGSYSSTMGSGSQSGPTTAASTAAWQGGNGGGYHNQHHPHSHSHSHHHHSTNNNNNNYHTPPPPNRSHIHSGSSSSSHPFRPSYSTNISPSQPLGSTSTSTSNLSHHPISSGSSSSSSTIPGVRPVGGSITHGATATANANAIPLGGTPHPLHHPGKRGSGLGGGGAGGGGVAASSSSGGAGFRLGLVGRGGGSFVGARSGWNERERDRDRERERERDRDREREMERDRVERDRVDRDRIERDRVDRERLDRDRSDRERLDRDRVDRSRDRSRERGEIVSPTSYRSISGLASDREKERDYFDRPPGPGLAGSNTGLPLRPPPSSSSIPTGPRGNLHHAPASSSRNGSRSPPSYGDSRESSSWDREPGSIDEGFRDRRDRSRDRQHALPVPPEMPRGALISQGPGKPMVYGDIVRDFTVPNASASSSYARPSDPPVSSNYRRPSATPSSSRPQPTTYSNTPHPPASTIASSSANHTPLGGVGPPAGIPTGPRSDRDRDRNRPSERGGYSGATVPKSSWSAASDERDQIGFRGDDRGRLRDRWGDRVPPPGTDSLGRDRQSDRASVRSARSRESSRSRARTRSYSPPPPAGGAGPSGYSQRSGLPPSGPRAMTGGIKSPLPKAGRPASYQASAAYALVTPKASSPPHRTGAFVTPAAPQGSGVPARRYDARSVDGISNSTGGGGLGVGNWAKRKEMDRMMKDMRQGKGVTAVAVSAPASASASVAGGTYSDEEDKRMEPNGQPWKDRGEREMGAARQRSRSLSRSRGPSRDDEWSARRRSPSIRRGVAEDRTPDHPGASTAQSTPPRQSPSKDQDPITPLSAKRSPPAADKSSPPAAAIVKVEDKDTKPTAQQVDRASPTTDHTPAQARPDSHEPSTPPTPATPALADFAAPVVAATKPVKYEARETDPSPPSQVPAESPPPPRADLAKSPDRALISRDNALGLQSPSAREADDVEADHPPTSPLTEIQPSSPARRPQSSLLLEDEDKTAPIENVDQQQDLLTSPATPDLDLPLDHTVAGNDSASDSTEKVPPSPTIVITPPAVKVAIADADESDPESERSIETYGKEFLEFDASTHQAARDLIRTRRLESAGMTRVVDDVLTQNVLSREEPNVRAEQAKHVDSWQIAQRKANHPSTWVRQIVARRTSKGKEEHKRYIQALQDEWAKLDEAWQQQRLMLEEENDSLRKAFEALLPPPTPAADKDARPAPRNRRRGAVDTEQQMLGIHDGDEAGLERILNAIRQAEEADPVARARKTEAVIPDMILDPSGYQVFYDDNSSLVKDPLEFYDTAHKTDIEWSNEEDVEFRRLYAQFPKRFGEIAEHLPGRSPSECVHHYYLAKKEKAFKEPVRGGARLYKDVPMSSIANGRNGITAPRSRFVGMVRGKSVGLDSVDKETGPVAAQSPAPTSARKQAKRKLEDTTAVPVKVNETPVAAVPKVRKKPGPKPGTKRKPAVGAAGIPLATTAETAEPAGDAVVATPAKRRKTVAKPRSKKATDVNPPPTPSSEPMLAVTPTTSSATNPSTIYPRTVSDRPQTVMTYPGSVSFRPGPQMGSWNDSPQTASSSYATPTRTSEGRYALPTYSSSEPLGHTSQNSPYSHLSAVPKAATNDKEISDLLPEQPRRSNISDLLNASSDDVPGFSIAASRSTPLPDHRSFSPNDPNYRPSTYQGHAFGSDHNPRTIVHPAYGRSLPTVDDHGQDLAGYSSYGGMKRQPPYGP